MFALAALSLTANLGCAGGHPVPETGARRAEGPSIEERLTRGQARLAGSDYGGAEQDLLAVVALRPKDPIARLRLSELYLVTGRFERAITEAESAAKLDAGVSRRAVELHASARFEMGKLGAAEALGRRSRCSARSPL
jgi:predicted Zn-dependent protease